jgi:hypothetical protein
MPLKREIHVIEPLESFVTRGFVSSVTSKVKSGCQKLFVNTVTPSEKSWAPARARIRGKLLGKGVRVLGIPIARGARGRRMKSGSRRNGVTVRWLL